MFGSEIVERERIVVNRAFEQDEFVSMGELPSGAGFYVNRLAVDCDLLVTEGFIEPHFFAGFSGGRKSILPGICSAETVNENHSYKAIASPFAAAGVLEGNPIHEDMICAARRVNVQFILNVALNARQGDYRGLCRGCGSRPSGGLRYIRSISRGTGGGRGHCSHLQRGLSVGSELVPVAQGGGHGGGLRRGGRGDHHGLRVPGRHRRFPF